MSMIESTFRLSTLVLAAACIALPAAARGNPEDAVSNPDKLQYSDVKVGYADMKPDFARDGVLAEQLGGIRSIQPGMAQEKVLQTLGEPLARTAGSRGRSGTTTSSCVNRNRATCWCVSTRSCSTRSRRYASLSGVASSASNWRSAEALLERLQLGRHLGNGCSAGGHMPRYSIRTTLHRARPAGVECLVALKTS